MLPKFFRPSPQIPTMYKNVKWRASNFSVSIGVIRKIFEKHEKTSQVFGARAQARIKKARLATKVNAAPQGTLFSLFRFFLLQAFRHKNIRNTGKKNFSP